MHLREEKEKMEEEIRERERIKNMTDAERAAWEAANPKVWTSPGCTVEPITHKSFNDYFCHTSHAIALAALTQNFDVAPAQELKNTEKSKLRFMQKYWHKGAYFQEEADDDRTQAGGYDIFKRDFSAPTGEDKFDRAALPKVMQVGSWMLSGYVVVV